MIYKSIEELSVLYLEAIGFKHNDHVMVLFKNGDTQQGKLSFKSSFIELKPTKNITISMLNAIALSKIDIRKYQPLLYDIVDDYFVTCEILGITNNKISGYSPRKIFNDLYSLIPTQTLNMYINSKAKTINIFPDSFKLNI